MASEFSCHLSCMTFVAEVQQFLEQPKGATLYNREAFPKPENSAFEHQMSVSEK